VSEKGEVFLITGVPGVGKSSVSRALLGRFEFGFYVPVDDLREWVVSGLAHPVPVWTEETGRQFVIARRAAVELARIYAGEGFAVVIDDVLLPGEGEEVYESALEGYKVHKVFLWAELAVNRSRNRERTNKNFDTAGLEGLIGRLHEWMKPEAYGKAGWMVVDSTGLGVEETVDAVVGSR
jgi:chloramphenicol 3-O-phosphotransferase